MDYYVAFLARGLTNWLDLFSASRRERSHMSCNDRCSIEMDSALYDIRFVCVLIEAKQERQG